MRIKDYFQAMSDHADAQSVLDDRRAELESNNPAKLWLGDLDFEFSEKGCRVTTVYVGKRQWVEMEPDDIKQLGRIINQWLEYHETTQEVE